MPPQLLVVFSLQPPTVQAYGSKVLIHTTSETGPVEMYIYVPQCCLDSEFMEISSLFY